MNCAYKPSLMPGLVGKVGETLFLVSQRGTNLVVLEKCEGPGILRAASRVGSTVPIECTATGALYMAHMPDEFIASEIAAQHGLEAHWLSQRAQQALEQGWSSNFELWQTGLAVLAALIVVRNHIRGVIALAASTPQLAALGGEALAPLVVRAANAVSRRARGEWQ